MMPACIFTVDENLENSLWSFCTEDSTPVLESVFDLWSDEEALKKFFTEHQSELEHYYEDKELSVDDAVLKTIDEATEFQDYLLDLIEQGADEGIPNLDTIFKAFDNMEAVFSELRLSKAQYKGRRGWLRLYAVRVGANCYLITGGAIKLRQDMEPEYLKAEKRKLRKGRDWCRDNGISEPQDLNDYLQ